MYQVELVWNREFRFVPFGATKETLQEAITYAKSLEDMGDGARVKKTRIVNLETDEITSPYQYSNLLTQTKP